MKRTSLNPYTYRCEAEASCAPERAGTHGAALAGRIGRRRFHGRIPGKCPVPQSRDSSIHGWLLWPQTCLHSGQRGLNGGELAIA